MLYVWLGLGLLAIILGGILLRWWQLRRRPITEPLSEVCQQHIKLLHGGQLDEAELDATKKRYAQWLRDDHIDRIEASLVPGLSYIVRVRALAELGTDAACKILERQLNRIIIDDPVEQSWYWIDVAHCLHMLAHEDSLPVLLDHLTEVDDFPLVHFYAAEIVAFHGFTSYLKEFPEKYGEAAIRAVYRTLEGLRCDISAHIVAETRLGEMIESIWDQHQHIMHPLLVRLFAEVLRHQRRAPQYSSDMADEHFEQEAYNMQVSHLASLEDDLIGYLAKAKQVLPRRTDFSTPDALRDWLEALQELRADAGNTLVRLLRDNPNLPLSEQAIITLGWSKAPQAAAFLRETAARTLPATQKPTRWWQWKQARKLSHQAPITAAALIALRHHPSEESEQLILAGSRSADMLIRSSAISSLGWWEPVRRKAVLMYLQDARYDGDSEVRYAARAALARLGERQALQWFRQGLASENRQIVMESIQAIADEGITLLWPELDRLVDEEEPDLASCAREALEQMQEELERN